MTKKIIICIISNVNFQKLIGYMCIANVFLGLAKKYSQKLFA